MKVPFEGGCLCGEIRYECSAKPELMYYCHCTDCQKTSGTAFHAGLYMARDSFEITSGTLRTFSATADSGRTIVRHFCGHCGAHVYSDKGVQSTMLSVKAGSLDRPEKFKPNTEIWTQSKVAWAQLPSDLKAFKQGPFD